MFTIEEVESTIQGIALGTSTICLMVTDHLQPGKDAEAGCNMAGARCSRILTICSTVRTEGIQKCTK